LNILPIAKVIPQKNIVLFAPHFDDFLLTAGGYFYELKKHGLLGNKRFHVIVLFSVNNYIAGSGQDNYDASPERLKLATGSALIEDTGCVNELLGEFNYRYELGMEKDCLLRGKLLTEGEMEFPHGMYEDFNEEDWKVFERMQARVRQWAAQEDTALIFPLAIREHMDHFITREAALSVARDLGLSARAQFYFQEDKPYAGMAGEQELERIDRFVRSNSLEERLYSYEPEKVIELAFKHYKSQVEEIYREAIRDRSRFLMENYKTDVPCDRIFVYNP
jgi:hypothetical protein